MGRKGIGEPEGRVLVLPEGNFEKELVQAAAGENLAHLLKKLLEKEPFELNEQERKALGKELFDLDISRAKILDNLQWIDVFMSFVMNGRSSIRLRDL
ncbi:MAG: hypothetical protein GXP49_16020 [Deltaproteobacteria bacterium]|nr:hypothetical protein [Deltaproteobacteria bacterium]